MFIFSRIYVLLCFFVKYSEIKSMLKESYFQSSKRGGYEEYLIINTLENTFSVLTHSTNITCIDYNELSKFILDKNPNIIVEDEVKKGTSPFTLFRENCIFDVYFNNLLF